MQLLLEPKPYNWLKAALRKHPVRDSFPPFPAAEVLKASKAAKVAAKAPSSLPFATAMSRMAQRQRTTEEMPRKEQVETVLYNLSHQYGSPACDEDLEVRFHRAARVWELAARGDRRTDTRGQAAADSG